MRSWSWRSKGCVWGGFGTTGQRCTAASRVVVHERVYDEFLEEFSRRVKALRVGDGATDGVQMGPSISESQLATVMKYVEIGKQEGATLVVGGHRLASGSYARGWFHEPTIFARRHTHRCVSRARKSSVLSCR